jgi:Ni/Co efflux regulator RcnB
MKTCRLRSILFAAMAAASLGAGAAHAQQYYPPGQPPAWHHWHSGDRYYGPRHVVTNWRHYRLPPPPRGSVWVHEGPQFVLIGRHGYIARVWGP